MTLTRTHRMLIIGGIVLVILVAAALAFSRNPVLRGSLTGDRDGDSIADSADACPDVPGVAPDGCMPEPLVIEVEATAEATPES